MRIWKFGRLKNDLAAAGTGTLKDPSWQCIKDLSDSGLKEQTKYWLNRQEEHLCNTATPPEPSECEHIEDNLRYAKSLKQEQDTHVKSEADHALAVIHKKDQKLEASCLVDCPTPKKFTEVADVSKKAEEQACCEIFRQRDGKDLSDKACHDLHTGSDRLEDRHSCLTNIGWSIIKGIWGSIKGTAIFANDIVEGTFDFLGNILHPGDSAFFSGVGTIITELKKDPAKFGEVVGLALLRTFTGIDSGYSDCLDKSQKSKYVCDNVGTIVSQVGMLWGGWGAITAALRKGGLKAVELIGSKSSGLAKAAKEVEGIEKAVLKPVAAATTTDEAVAAGGTAILHSENDIKTLTEAATQPLTPAKAVSTELRSARAKLGKLTQEKKQIIARAHEDGEVIQSNAPQLVDVEKRIAAQKAVVAAIKDATKPAETVAELTAKKEALEQLAKKVEDPVLQKQTSDNIARTSDQIAAAATAARNEANGVVKAYRGTKAVANLPVQGVKCLPGVMGSGLAT